VISAYALNVSLVSGRQAPKQVPCPCLEVSTSATPPRRGNPLLVPGEIRDEDRGTLAGASFFALPRPLPLAAAGASERLPPSVAVMVPPPQSDRTDAASAGAASSSIPPSRNAHLIGSPPQLQTQTRQCCRPPQAGGSSNLCSGCL